MTLPAEDPSIARITAWLGRPLRVLHIGNIANNAYNNAKIQRQYGIDADVICHDYYHVMATPEWEDGGLTTRLDPYLPNWWASNLKGFKRPEWYVQGPLALCLEYLDARRRGQPARLWNAASAIEDAYVAKLQQDAILNQRPWRDPRPFLHRHHTLTPIAAALKKVVVIRLSSVLDAPRRFSTLPQQVRQLIVWPLLAASIARPPAIAGHKLVIGAYAMARRLLGRKARDTAALMREAARLVPGETRISWGGALLRLGSIVLQAVWIALLLPFFLPVRWLSRQAWPTEPVAPLEERQRIAAGIIDAMVPKERWATLPEEDRQNFETQIVHQALLFAPVLKHYDVIQGYSIDGFIPLVNGSPAFASYEHGTLRELPFENSLTGLICNIAYSRSPVVFVTNTDVLPSVARLGLPPLVVHNLPHAFDDRKLMNWRDAHPELAPPADEVVFFSPTRQHWRDSNRSLTKGNDIMLRAAGELWAEGCRFRLLLVEWGQDIEATRALIEALGFTQAVTWIPPMGKQELWRTYCTSHAVLDQFVLPALGGVGFEVLTLGCRLITLTDQTVLKEFFGAAPPVMPAGGVAETVASMRAVLDDPADLAAVGPAGRVWIDTWHSARRTVSIQAEAYERLLGMDRAESGPIGA